MESGNSRRVEKRSYVVQSEDEDGIMPGAKKPKLPALASVIVEALKLDSLQRLCSSLEPLLRRIVSEEIERALSKLGPATLTARSSPPRIQGPEGKNLHLQFRTKMPPHLFTGGKVEGEQGAAIHVFLVNLTTGNIVQKGIESVIKLNVVVLEGDFNDEDDDNWTKNHFESHEVKEREGKRPLLTGDLHVVLKDGVGTLGDLTFTDNSSWIRSRKFRLGVKVAPGYCEEIRVREAKTEAFAVKDHRGELYKKHYPPALHDEVWRLDRIAKDGALHKKLIKAEVITVEDFLRILVRDPQRLRHVLGSGMSNRMWENTVEHAKTCILNGKLYVYCTDEAHSNGVVFNHIYELSGLIADGQFLPLESLTNNQKVSVDSLVKRAYENWNQVVEYDGSVLNSLLNNGQQHTSTTPPPQNHNNRVLDFHYTTTNTQNRQQQLFISSEPNSQPHPVVPHLIEFPFVRPDPVDVNNTDFFSGDWNSRARNGSGLEELYSEELRVRSSEMLESDDMQRLLKTFNIGSSAFCHSEEEEACYSHNTLLPYDEPHHMEELPRSSSSSGKAVVGWLKLKAALRWGIFVKKRAAHKRAQLIEIDDD